MMGIGGRSVAKPLKLSELEEAVASFFLLFLVRVAARVL